MDLVQVKLTTPWKHNYYSQTNNNSGIYDGYKFEINNDTKSSDWWIVWGNLPEKETVNISPDNIIYITDEVHNLRQFNNSFLKQFPKIASVRSDLDNFDCIRIHEFCPWYFKKNYNEIIDLKPVKKTKIISIVSSDLTLLEGHKKRYAFVNKLIGHFKDKIDVFGRGFSEIPDKWDALVDYKYSIAIENNRVENYFTEKISECFLTYTYPIYFGCPNISDFYAPESYKKIDIEDYIQAFRIIEELIDSDKYEQFLPSIIESRNLFLTKYHMFPAIVKLIEGVNIKKSFKKSGNVTLYPEQFYNPTGNLSFVKTSKMLIKSVAGKFF